jgi:solute carrier family 25 phosphate transporter 23/24/25/41
MQITKNTNNNFISVTKDIIKKENIGSLWKGNILNCMRIFPYSSIQFATYDYCKYKSNINGSNITIQHRLLFGLIAGSVASTITHPIDVIRHRIICYPNIKNVKHSIKDIYLENGIKNLYKGYGSTMFSLVPFIGINFCIYDYLKDNTKESGSITILGLGGISALISQTICYPLDTIRRRMQLSGNEYKNGLDVLSKIIRNEGILKLYSGMLPNMIKIVPNNSIRFLVYEIMKKTFNN